MQTVTIKEKSVYGRTLLYPGCQNAATFLLLTGTKTFDEAHIRAIKALGFVVNIIKIPA